MIEVGDGEGGGDPLAGLGGGAPAKRSAASSVSKVRLTAEEERVYRKVDGTRTVQVIVDATGMGEFDVCRVLFDLLNRNIISTVGRGDVAETIHGGVEAPPSPVPGYAVLGLAAALSLAALAARWSDPFAVVGRPPLLRDPFHRVIDAVNSARLQRVDRALVARHLAAGELPRTLEELVDEGLADRSYLKDLSARPYHYAHTQNGYLLSAVDDRGRTDPATVIERVLPVDRP
jgi:hypothetical protein